MSIHIFKNGKIVEANNEKTSINQALKDTETVVEKEPVATYTVQNALKYINSNNDSQDNRRRLTASHVMTTKVITANPNCIVDRVITTLTHQECSHIVIVDDKRKPLAVHHLDTLIRCKKNETTVINDLAYATPATVKQKTLVRDIAILFIEKGFTAVTVVDELSQLVGIITQSDLMSLLISSPHQKITV